MTEGTEEFESQGEASGDEEVGSQETGGDFTPNPAWEELLSALPEEYHSKIAPQLQKWDSNFDRVQSQFAPYKSFADQGLTAENLEYATNLARLVDSDPMQVIKALTDYSKQNNLWVDPEEESADEGQGQIDDGEFPDISKHPEFVKMRQIVESLGTTFLEQREAEQAAQQDAELAEQIDNLTEEHGEFDVKWVLHQALMDVESGVEVDDLTPYVQQYRELEKSIIEKANRPAPKLIPNGGAAPTNQQDLKALSEEERRQYIVDTLKASQS